jgi:hypothetical protein
MQKNKSPEPITNTDYLDTLLRKGYTIMGPRKDPSRDLASFKAFLKKGREFAPENWLADNGYKFVEPSTFTKGHRIAYKTVNNVHDERFNSNYRLVIGDKEIVLYLKMEMPEMP